MSRVHDALRKAEQAGAPTPPVHTPVAAALAGSQASPGTTAAVAEAAPPAVITVTAELWQRIREIPFQPLPEAHLIDAGTATDAPSEEFRTLRTRLNHMQSLQPIHTLVVTSPSPAEGKSFTAVNLALAQSHLAGNQVLLADFDFRRPIVHNLFQINRSPGITDFLLGKAALHEVIYRIAGSNLCILPAGEAVLNPLELLNLPQVKNLLDQLPNLFNWVVIDSPPLLFAADANLLSTLCHGTLMVVRIGTTTIDSVTRAMQSLCQNNVIGVAVNGARRGELYSKYTYYHSYYYSHLPPPDDEANQRQDAAAGEESRKP